MLPVELNFLKYELRAGLSRSKQKQLCLTVTRAFQRVKEQSFGMCHEKAKRIFDFSARCLLGRLVKAKETLTIERTRRIQRVWS
jgi:hypothetical protein